MKILDYFFGVQEQGAKSEIDVFVNTSKELKSKAKIVFFPLYSSNFRDGKHFMELHLSDGKIFKDASKGSYFDAMFDLRKQLEKENIKLCCWGAKKNSLDFRNASRYGIRFASQFKRR